MTERPDPHIEDEQELPTETPEELSEDLLEDETSSRSSRDWKAHLHLKIRDPLAWLWVAVAVLFVGNLGLLASSRAEVSHADELSQQLEEQNEQFDRLSFWQKLWEGEGEPKPLRVSAFDGLPIDPETEEAVINVMIDNFSLARPQHSGIRSASVVYEALAEGGITRLMLQFPYQELTRVGPVRSARDYFVDFAEEHGGYYVHAGGSPTALDQIWASQRVINVDEDDRLEGDTYSFRDDDLDAPHNLFFDLFEVKEWAEEKDYAYTAREPDWCFLEDLEEPEEPRELEEAEGMEGVEGLKQVNDEVTLIEIDFSNDSTSSYYVQFEYDAKLDTYRRYYGSAARAPHIDSYDSLQVMPQNIIIQEAPSYLIEGDEKERLTMENVGSGPATLYRNGKKIVGEWSKPTSSSMTEFTDLSGNTFCLQPGQTWIAVVDSMDLVEEKS